MSPERNIAQPRSTLLDSSNSPERILAQESCDASRLETLQFVEGEAVLSARGELAGWPRWLSGWAGKGRGLCPLVLGLRQPDAMWEGGALRARGRSSRGGWLGLGITVIPAEGL